MKILYITTSNIRAQGDLLEVSILNGLRELIGSDCIEYPEKKIMYHNWSDTSKNSLHGGGFSLYKLPIKLIDINQRNNFLNEKTFDIILFGTLGQYDNYPNYDYITNTIESKKIWYLDGHDLYGYAPKMIKFNGEVIIGNQKTNCFKRELVIPEKDVYPTGFGIPEYQIKNINLVKKQYIQKTAPSFSKFENNNELGVRTHHIFTDEDEYYDDMNKSWFGLTCKKGGWDCLRHYEILASGALLLFRDYDKKPIFCSPQNLPCFSYNSFEELSELMNRLVINNKPTDEYLDMLMKQRTWLIENGTTLARAKNILEVIKNNL